MTYIHKKTGYFKNISLTLEVNKNKYKNDLKFNSYRSEYHKKCYQLQK